MAAGSARKGAVLFAAGVAHTLTITRLTEARFGVAWLEGIELEAGGRWARGLLAHKNTVGWLAAAGAGRWAGGLIGMHGGQASPSSSCVGGSLPHPDLSNAGGDVRCCCRQSRFLPPTPPPHLAPGRRMLILGDSFAAG